MSAFAKSVQRIATGHRNRYGSTVILANGKPTTARIEENPETVAIHIAVTNIDVSNGKLVVFFFNPGTIAKSGDMVQYRNINWSLTASRQTVISDVVAQMVFVGQSGAVR